MVSKCSMLNFSSLSVYQNQAYLLFVHRRTCNTVAISCMLIVSLPSFIIVMAFQKSFSLQWTKCRTQLQYVKIRVKWGNSIEVLQQRWTVGGTWPTLWNSVKEQDSLIFDCKFTFFCLLASNYTQNWQLHHLTVCNLSNRK